jgi:hypothetical protein
VTGIAAAEIQCDDPAAVAARWAEIAELPVSDRGAHPEVALDNATLRFVPCGDGRPEGLGGIDLIAADRDAVLAAARARGLVIQDGVLLLCGMRIGLV